MTNFVDGIKSHPDFILTLPIQAESICIRHIANISRNEQFNRLFCKRQGNLYLVCKAGIKGGHVYGTKHRTKFIWQTARVAGNHGRDRSRSGDAPSVLRTHRTIARRIDRVLHGESRCESDI